MNRVRQLWSPVYLWNQSQTPLFPFKNDSPEDFVPFYTILAPIALNSWSSSHYADGAQRIRGGPIVFETILGRDEYYRREWGLELSMLKAASRKTWYKDYFTSVLMRDLFSKYTTNPFYSVPSIPWTGPAFTHGSRVDVIKHLLVSAFLNTGANSSSNTRIDNLIIDARSGFIALTKVNGVKVPRIYQDLNKYGNLTTYQYTNMNYPLPHPPSEYSPKIKIATVVQRKWVRKMRANLFLERNLFDVPYGAVRLWTNVDTNHYSQTEGVIDSVIKSDIIAHSPKAEIIVEDKPELSSILFNTSRREVNKSPELISSAIRLVDSPDAMKMRYVV